MAECRIILERHGQSEGNLNNAFLGHTDLPLTELGQRQASCTALYLRNEDIDVMYSSDLKRAYQTGTALAQLKHMELIPDRELREIYAGAWEGKSFKDIATAYEKDYRIWLEDIGSATCTEGESVAELDKRICNEVFRLAKLHPGKTVFISTHATPIRLLKMHAKGLPLERMSEEMWVPNASVTVLGVEADRMRILKDTYAEHLGELLTAVPKGV